MASEPHPPYLDDAIERYRAGDSIMTIAAELQLDRHRLSRELRAAGVEVTRRRPVLKRRTELPMDELLELYRSGVSEKALAERYGVSRTVIRPRLLEAGVEIRDRSAAMYQRMATASPEERKRLVKAAHAARRGGGLPAGHHMVVARGKQRTRGAAGDLELELQAMLEALGWETTHQYAVGNYNLDLARPPFAVEVHISTTNPLKLPRLLRRTERLTEAGWSVFYVWVSRNRRRIEPAVAEQLVTWAQEVQRLPSFPGHYRVVRGTGKHVASGRGGLDQITLEPAPVRPL